MLNSTLTRTLKPYLGLPLRLLHLQLALNLPHLRGFPGVRHRGLGPDGLMVFWRSTTERKPPPGSPTSPTHRKCEIFTRSAPFPLSLRHIHAQLRARRVHRLELFQATTQGLNLATARPSRTRRRGPSSKRSAGPQPESPRSSAAGSRRCRPSSRDGSPPSTRCFARRQCVDVARTRVVGSFRTTDMRSPNRSHAVSSVFGFGDVDHHGRPAPEGIAEQHRERGVAVRHVSRGRRPPLFGAALFAQHLHPRPAPRATR